MLQAGIPDEPIVMLSTVSRSDLTSTFALLRPESKPGFVGNIPCSGPRIGPLSITFLALLPSGATTAFTMQTVATLHDRDTKDIGSTVQYVCNQTTSILFLTDSLSSLSKHGGSHLSTLRELGLEGYVITVLETDPADSAEQVDHNELLASGITRLSAEQQGGLDQIVRRHLDSFDVIWVTQPGGLRLVEAVNPLRRSRVIFEPRVMISDDIISSNSEISVERHVFATRPAMRPMTHLSAEKEQDSEGWIDIRLAPDTHRVPVSNRVLKASYLESRKSHASVTSNNGKSTRLVSCEGEIGVVYTLQWFAALANIADIVVARDDQNALELTSLGINRVCVKAGKLGAIVEGVRASPQRGVVNLTQPYRESILHGYSSSSPVEPLVPDIAVDIVVPVHNAARDLSNCLDLLRSNTDLPSHLILVDDCSSDPHIQEILLSLPTKLRGTSIECLTIIRLRRNAGFAGAVNIGIATGFSPYVVLLNSDTLLPPQWLSRLISPLKSDKTVGSVTPLSNSATICSLRPPFQAEQSFNAKALLQVDALLARYGTKQPITIPTGVGYCFASRRSIYDQVGLFDADLFRRMYGEENDWCMRVTQAGLRNVVVTNLYVPHVDGSSVKESNLNRREILRRSQAKLRALHSGYDASVQEFERRDPLKPLRSIMHLVLLREQKRPATTLYVHNPELLGGSSKYLDQLLRRRFDSGEVLILAVTPTQTFLQCSQYESQERMQVDGYMHDDASFRELLSVLNIQEIVVNQLVGSEYYTSTERIRNSGIPYMVHLHDFFYACPTITLIGHRGQYCGGETRPSRCSVCLRKCFGESSDTGKLSISAWREHSYEFLQGASTIVTVSEQTKQIYLKYFPNLTIHVEEPLATLPQMTRTLNDAAIVLPTLNVAVIGAIGKHKGSDIIYEMVEMLKNRALPIRIVVCGYTDRHAEPYVDPHGFFEVTGRYENRELPRILDRYRIAFTLLPSIWPETYLYTASESLACGYPVMVSGLTAAAQRITAHDAGWVLDDLTPRGIIGQLERLFHHREEIREKTRNILFTEAMLSDPNAPVSLADQHPFKDFLVEF